MAFDVSGLFSNINLAGALPSGTDILNNVALGAVTSVILAGAKTQAGGAALDPLGLFPHQGNAPIAPQNNPNVTSGPTITASAYAQLPPGTQAQLAATGVHIISG